jgi:hydroxylysine kinase
VHGIPGFESGDSAETLDFVSLDEDAALSIAREYFDLDPSVVTRLETERDDSFRLETPAGGRVLKIAHPADSWLAIDVQLRAMLHATSRDHGLPLQRIIHPSEGGLWQSLPDGRVARVFDWLDGDLLLHSATGPNELDALGDMLGRLSKALSTFEDKFTLQSSAWDIQELPRLAQVAAMLPDDSVNEALDRFTSRVVPQLGSLPTQVIHNDFNPGNVLVDQGSKEFVVGILDFGDIVHSLRVADLAVAISYQLTPLRHNWLDIEPMIAAFARHVPVSDLERKLLPDLVAARFVQRILVNGWLARNGQRRDSEHDANVSALTALLDLEN